MHELRNMHFFHAAVVIEERIIITVTLPSLEMCNKLQVDCCHQDTVCVIL